MTRFAWFALVTVAASAAAQDAPIIVTGRPLPEARGEAAYGAVTIPSERLSQNASGRIEDVLGDVAGFAQFRRTDSRAANPSSQGATLRALGGNAASRALVLVDGVPVADPFSGFIPYSALRPERFTGATITRGGGAGAFGAGAVAGTIALESGDPDTLPALSTRASGGSFGASELSGGVVHRLGGGFASVHAGWDRGDGYVLIPPGQRGPADVPARYDAWSVALRAVAPLSPATEVQASALLFDDHRLRGAAGTASRSRGADASVRFVSRGRWGVEALAYVQERGFRSGFVSVDAARAIVTPTLDQFATPALGLGGKIELRPPVGPGRSIRIGADVRRASGQTNEFFRFQNGQPTRLRRAGGINTTGGVFAEGGIDIGALTLTGGARIDRWRIAAGFLTEQPIGGGAATLDQHFADRSGTEISTRGGAVVSLGRGFSLRAAGYAGFRVPTLNELYRPFRVGADATAANGALDLERLRGVEAGVNFVRGRTRIGVTMFANRLGGAITNVTLGTGPGSFPQVGTVAAGGVFRQRLNVDAIAVHGVEANATLPLGRFTLSASYAFSDARVRATGAAAALNDKRPAQSPLHSASATFSYNAPALSAAATLRYAGARFDDDLAARRLPDALTVDALVSVRVTPHVSLIARAENLFDAKIISGLTASGVEDLGTPRTLWLGIRFAR